MAELVAGESGFTDTGLSGATEYAYAVFARDGVPNYATSATTTVITGCVPEVIHIVGTIESDTTWNVICGATYVLDGEVTVAAGVTLRVLPGAVVKAVQSARITVLGSLIAEGTAEAPVVFTSIGDDTAGGDTGGDGVGGGPLWWSGIGPSENPSGDSAGELSLRHVDIRFGSVTGRAPVSFSLTDSVLSHGSVNIEASSDLVVRSVVTSGDAYEGNVVLYSYAGSVEVVDCRLSGGISVRSWTDAAVVTGNSAGAGINVDAPSPTVMGNHVEGVAYSVPAVTVRGALWPDRLTGNTGVNNAMNVMSLAGTLQADLTLPMSSGLPVIIGVYNNYPTWNGLTVAAGVTLRVLPGAVVKAVQSARITVLGSLIAEGTAEAPVVFTSIGDDTAGGDTGGDGSAAVPGPMDWGGLLVPAESSDAVMALNNVRLSFASVAVDVQGPSLVKLRGRVLGSAVGVRSTGVLVDATGVDWGSPLGPNTSEAQLVQGSVAYVPWTGWQAPVLPALTPQSYDPPTFTCEDYVAFGLRGSGEAPQYPRSDDGTSAYGSDWSTGFGGFNWEAYNAYRAGVLEIRPETTFKAIAVRYRALNVTYNYVDFANPGYVDSIMEGASKLYQYIHDELKPENCPNQRILIFGYSQGALSAHLAINLMERQGDPALSMIAGVVLVSDPARIAWGGESLWQGVDVDDELVPAGVVVLPSNGAWTGAMNSTGVAEFTPTVAARTSAICHEHDPVCAYTLINSTFFPLQFFSFADHQNYSHSELNALGRSASLISLQP